MIDTIYVEHAVADHPRTKTLLSRFPQATVIPCDRYTEVFNRRAQDFRIQKQNPALLLAHKHKNHVLPAPDGYGIGGKRNFYFSHLLNCLYDCRYCFLQGMYRSANYVLFVNYEDFDDAIAQKAQESDEDAFFFSGYDCDSLALENITGFCEHTLPIFEKLPHAWLELRTKSVNIRALLAREPLERVIVAFSMTPEAISTATEHGAPPLRTRLGAMKKLAKAGWRLGLRIDPIIFDAQYQKHYAALLDHVFRKIDPGSFHSVSLGPLRFPKTMHEQVVSLYPEEPILAGPFAPRGKMVSYPAALETEMIDFCTSHLERFVPKGKLFSCLPEAF